MCAKQNNKGNVDNTAERKALLQQTYDYQTRLQGVANDLAVKLAQIVSEADKEIAKKAVEETLKLQATAKKASKAADVKEVKKLLAQLKKAVGNIEKIYAPKFSHAKDITVSTAMDVFNSATKETAKEIELAFEEQRLKTRKAVFSDWIQKGSVKAIIEGQSIQGQTIQDWFSSWGTASLERIARVCQQAMVEEMSVEQITLAIRGTKEKNYTDGILGKNAARAAMIARTLINGTANNARIETIKANLDAIDGVKFIGTLDGKMCPHCAPLDGQIWYGEAISQVRRPPLHPNCRCTVVPYIQLRDKDGNPVDVEGTRPAANADFDKLAQENYAEKAKDKGWTRTWEELPNETKLQFFYGAQRKFEKETGQPAFSPVDSSLTFADYFKSQPDSFKRDWLGAGRYRRYKNGSLTDDNLFKPELSYMSSAKVLFNITRTDAETAEELKKLADLQGTQVGTQKGIQAALKEIEELRDKLEAERAQLSAERNKLLFPTGLQLQPEPTELKEPKEPKEKEKGKEKDYFPADLSKIKNKKYAGGSTGAVFCESDGNRFIMKTGANQGHIKSECEADAFYRAAGVNVPEFRLYDDNGKLTKLSKRIENAQSLDDWWNNASKKEKEEMSKKLRKDYAADILLGNWDVVGMSADNIIIDKDNVPWRIDNGGALSYRAQGAKKNHADWDAGFIDDLWTMTNNGARINSQISSSIPYYFGSVTVLELAKEIAEKDWEPALKTLSDADRRIVEKRIFEAKQISNRADGFLDNGYTERFTDVVADTSYLLSKKGLREACSFRVYSDPSVGGFGWLRDNSSNNRGLEEGNVQQRKFRDKLETAIFTVEDYAANIIQDLTPHQQKLDELFEYENTLKKLSQYHTPNADYYLSIIEKVRECAQNRTPLPTYDIDKELFNHPENPAMQTTKFSDYLRSAIGDDPVDLMEDFHNSQGQSSYDPTSVVHKYCRLLSRGINFKDYANFDEFHDDMKAKGYYFGLKPTEGRGEPVRHYRNIKRTFGDYAQHPQNEIDEVVNDIAKYQAALVLALENLEFIGNDHEKGSIILFRTEDEDVINSDRQKNIRPGELATHTVGINESHSHDQAVDVYGDRLIMMRMPYSRITGSFFIESKHGDMFMDDGEAEFTADSNGIDRYYMGVVGRRQNEDIAAYIDKFEGYERKEEARRAKAAKAAKAANKSQNSGGANNP